MNYKQKLELITSSIKYIQKLNEGNGGIEGASGGIVHYLQKNDNEIKGANKDATSRIKMGLIKIMDDPQCISGRIYTTGSCAHNLLTILATKIEEETFTNKKQCEYWLKQCYQLIFNYILDFNDFVNQEPELTNPIIRPTRPTEYTGLQKLFFTSIEKLFIGDNLENHFGLSRRNFDDDYETEWTPPISRDPAIIPSQKLKLDKTNLTPKHKRKMLKLFHGAEEASQEIDEKPIKSGVNNSTKVALFSKLTARLDKYIKNSEIDDKQGEVIKKEILNKLGSF